MSISTLLRFQRCAYELLGSSGARVMKVSFLFHFLSFSGLGRLSVSISTLLRFRRCAYELLGWSGARVMKVFISVSLLSFSGLGRLLS